jgi:hypothetical protein
LPCRPIPNEVFSKVAIVVVIINVVVIVVVTGGYHPGIENLMHQSGPLIIDRGFHVYIYSFRAPVATEMQSGGQS